MVAPAESSHPRAARLDDIDALRGLVMVLMALDHVREFLPGVVFDPLDIARTDAPLYFTRWITHFCAPVFMFLAGVGSGISAARGKPAGDLSRQLVLRGLWLVALELTVLWWFGWDFSLRTGYFSLAVIWALGVAMIALAGLIHLPRPAMLAIALGMIAGHNAFDGVTPDSLGPGWADLWRVLHVQGTLDSPRAVSWYVEILYPLVPWIGVMAAGYAFAPCLLGPHRQRWLVGLGAGAVVAFLILRATNLYGDLVPWTRQAELMRTMFSFLNCAKYPPSLCYLLMTLGPALLLLARFGNSHAAWVRPLVVFGRVPMMYYLLHLPLIHGMAILANLVAGRDPAWLFATWSRLENWPTAAPGRGFGLPVTYALWILAVLVLYPVCRWFSELKRRRRDWWLGYL